MPHPQLPHPEGLSGVVLVTGTGTEIGKTAVTAALAALALASGRTVAVLKPAQTGVGPDEPGDAAEVARLVGPDAAARGLTLSELARYPDPLAPATAAARAGLPPLTAEATAKEAARLAQTHDLVLVEGAGGLLVRYTDTETFADVHPALAALGVPARTVVVVAPGLGTLNHAALTAEALRARAIPTLGLVIGSWPAAPDLAARCNLADLPTVTALPLLGALPQGAPALPPTAYLTTARTALAPALGGTAADR